MDNFNTPYLLYVRKEGDERDINLSAIPTDLLLPIQKACKHELYMRSLKVDFQSERLAMGLEIEPKQLTLFQSKK